MTQTPPQQAVTGVIPTGEEIYDMIMSKIEVELTTSQLPLLKEKYKDETPEQAAARAARYQKAFEEYDRQYAEYVRTEEEALAAFHRSVTGTLQAVTQQEDAQALTQLESTFSSL